MAVAAAGHITMLSHTIGGYSEGLLAGNAGRDVTRQAAELERENARLREELARRDRRVRHLGEFASPADLGSIRWAGSTAADRVTVPSHQLAERHAEPLYEEAKRAARLWSDSDLVLLSADDRARSWRTDEYVRPS